MKTVEKNIEIFIEESVNHNAAIEIGDHKKANNAAKKIDKSFENIKKFGREGREALLELLDHERKEVSAMAAAYSLKYNPDKSLKVLKKLSKDKGILGFRASKAIETYQSGKWAIE